MNTDCTLFPEDTFPKLLLKNYVRWSMKVAMRKKKLGIWRSYTWLDCYMITKAICLGLMSFGMRRNDKVSILGDNNPEWFLAELAIQSAGGIPVGLTVDSTPAEIQFILLHSESRYIIAQDQEQIDKILQIKGTLPDLKQAFYWDDKGLRHYQDPILTSFQRLMALGGEYEMGHPMAFEDAVKEGKAEDVVMIQYTSGTTGAPKGVCISYRTFFEVNEAVRSVNPVLSTDEFVSITLPGWGVEQGFGLLYSLLVGQRFNFAENAACVQRDLREISPQTLLYPSRLWEQQASMIRLRMTESMTIKRILYGFFLKIGYRYADTAMKGGRPSIFLRCLYIMGNFFVFAPLRDKVGLHRIRVPYTAGAMLAPDVLRFFRAIGVKIRQLYGSTEGCTTALHGPDNFDYATVGAIAPGRCVRIANNGEILVDRTRSFSHYYRDNEATKRVIKGAWYYTGDAGYIDDNGQIVFIDRLADMQELSDGTQFSPQYIESRLKFSPYIKDCLVFGGKEKEYLGALVSIEYENVARWAEKKRLPYTTFADLSQKPETLRLVASEIHDCNKSLPGSSKIRRFASLPKEFDPDEAEMTRTRKLRRAFVERRYEPLLDAIYSDKKSENMEIPVAYKDGTMAVLRSPVSIVHVRD